MFDLQMDSLLLCLCSVHVVDHRWNRNVVRTKRWQIKVQLSVSLIFLLLFDTFCDLLQFTIHTLSYKELVCFIINMQNAVQLVTQSMHPSPLDHRQEPIKLHYFTIQLIIIFFFTITMIKDCNGLHLMILSLWIALSVQFSFINYHLWSIALSRFNVP